MREGRRGIISNSFEGTRAQGEVLKAAGSLLVVIGEVCADPSNSCGDSRSDRCDGEEDGKVENPRLRNKTEVDDGQLRTASEEWREQNVPWREGPS